ncbi:MAG TPA: radical SAM protein, partial [Spirochaetota bacterium]
MDSLISTLDESDCDALLRRAEALVAKGECCPFRCGIDRRQNKVPCGGRYGEIQVASFHPHRGEEPPVSGTMGAGNIFFSGCTLSCVFCQNYPFSHLHNGEIFSYEQFREKIFSLIAKGVHNLNLTTFDHNIYPVLAALLPVRKKIRIPIANNCAGFFTKETLEIALSFCDIFLYDVKYADETIAQRYSRRKEYVGHCWEGIAYLASRMIPFIEEDSLLKRGVIFRHLVLPGAIDNSLSILNRLSRFRDAGFDFRISIMSQYFPAHRAGEFPEINRRLAADEYGIVCDRLDELGFEGWTQE